MRIFSVTPIHVGPQELSRRQQRYDALLPSGLTLDLVDIGPQAPRSLDTGADVRASEAAVVAALRAAPQGYDVLMPDCVLDPGVAELAPELPVVGILQLSLGWQVVRGRRVGLVARNEAIADELLARAKAYDWAEHVAGVRVLGLAVEAISDQEQWTAGLRQAVDGFGDQVATVINGCSAVEVTGHGARRTRVVDPTALALRLLAAEGPQ
ncbi:MAG TPA: aspartate/glutamate racemase family protein [Intrasporangium sp.]|uniref:aspartate/glutamate racemase family protein n=1 Tax=Intrasporangium sp. TaxID=1925024 RepID=UPI002D778D94|nr:aspartate/glutamate racemase family protein [Intrasporangium sp.]HET7400101.1 aspartate/glutamate racemase family protein [Intrasporangium sp.]